MHENSPHQLPFPADYPTLLHALAAAVRTHGAHKIIAEDILKSPLTYEKFWWRMDLLAGALHPDIAAEKHVGIMLPTSLGGALTFFALQRNNIIPVMLNFSAGDPALKAAVEMIPLKRIITSRAFIEKAQLEHVITFLKPLVEVIYLEDVRTRISKITALLALFKLKVFGVSEKDIAITNAHQPAVILLTSGSEGVPKGVVLSHKNILTNIAQVQCVLSFTKNDAMLNAMPMFHSFGLVAGTLLPLLLGIRTFLYPSPLHYKQIPKLCRENHSTILLGTDTFLRGYAATAHDDDFSTLRLIVAGAEKLKESTSELYLKRFNIEILQGYGVTETSPVLACNTLENNQRGTVGKLMPHMEARLEPVEGIAEGGTLHVRGANVMLGYIKHDQPSVLQPANEWYDTGDVVTINSQGFIRIIGRVKRFAKIGGEMVSLAVVEELAHQLSPDLTHAAMAVTDERKGEQIILYSEDPNLTRDVVIHKAQAQGLSELYIPKQVKHLTALPRLGNGKLDYPAIGRLNYQEKAN
jgi:acyl-[acyl-carrier-protein]-phospholipid O-acyltransferase/long-chain-fatty-acid--[acyl-carrier-protein] ligase